MKNVQQKKNKVINKTKQKKININKINKKKTYKNAKLQFF